MSSLPPERDEPTVQHRLRRAADGNGGVTPLDARRWTCSRPRTLRPPGRPPGPDRGDVAIELEDNVLTVSGERKAEHEERRRATTASSAPSAASPLADAAGGHRRRGRHGQVRQRRARGPDPEARGAQAAQDHDRRRRRAGAKTEARSGQALRTPRHPRAAAWRPRGAVPHMANCISWGRRRDRAVLRDPHPRPRSRARTARSRSPTAQCAPPRSCRWPPRPRSRPRGRTRSARWATTWCSATRSTSSSRPGHELIGDSGACTASCAGTGR